MTSKRQRRGREWNTWTNFINSVEYQLSHLHFRYATVPLSFVQRKMFALLIVTVKARAKAYRRDQMSYRCFQYR